MPFVPCSKLKDATTEVKGLVELATVAETGSGADAERATTSAGLKDALSQSIAGGNAMQKAVVNAVEQAIGADAGAAQAIASALAADPNAAALLASSVPDASETVKGKVEIATAAENAAAASTTLAVTPGNLAAALNDTATAGGNALQDAVVNAVEQAIGDDAGAQTAIANAIADDVATAIANDPAAQATLAASLADDLGATAAETIAGAVPNKFISPDDLKAVLQNGADYYIYVKSSGNFYRDVAAGASSTNVASSEPGVIGLWQGPGSVPSGRFMAGALGGVQSGVANSGTASGVVGFSDATGGTNIGVYGRALNGTTNWAGYFEGDTRQTANAYIGTDNLVNLFDFRSQSKTGSGYQKLPGGLIIQWGTVAPINNASTVTASFPIAFPSSCIFAIASNQPGGAMDAPASNGVIMNSTTKTQITIAGYYLPLGVPAQTTAAYIALGY